MLCGSKKHKVNWNTRYPMEKNEKKNLTKIRKIWKSLPFAPIKWLKPFWANSMHHFFKKNCFAVSWMSQMMWQNNVPYRKSLWISFNLFVFVFGGENCVSIKNETTLNCFFIYLIFIFCASGFFDGLILADSIAFTLFLSGCVKNLMNKY